MKTTNCLCGLSFVSLLCLAVGAAACGGAPQDAANPYDPSLTEGPVVPAQAAEPVEEDASPSALVPNAPAPIDTAGIGGGSASDIDRGATIGGTGGQIPGHVGAGSHAQ